MKCFELTRTQTILTALPTGGGLTNNPADLPGVIRTTAPLCPEETPLQPGPTSPAGEPADNIFVPLSLDTQAIPVVIPSRNDHPIQKQNIVDIDVPIQTNKFYANFFLGNQNQSVWTHPYALFWARGRGNSYGMSVSHTERSELTYGPDPSLPQYFIAPVGSLDIVLSAAELREGTVMSFENLKAFSIYANFAPFAGSRNIMSIPVVQGMGLVTAVYDNAQPVLGSGVFFRTLKYVGSVNDAGTTFKYRVSIDSGDQWLVYVTPLRADGIPPLTLLGGGTISGPAAFSGLVQVTKNPNGTEGERYFDSSAGAYATEASISASIDGATGSYTLSWRKAGVSTQTLLMYGLPHHVETFDYVTRAAMTNIQLSTTTKGTATAVLADSFTMIEPDLPVTMGFAPWIKAPNGAQGGMGNVNLEASAQQAVNAAGTSELGQDFLAQTSLNSMYFSGKGLGKFAGVVYAMQTMAGNSNLAAAGLEKLKDAFNVFVNNTQPEPLVYDNVWKGVVSGASYRSPTKDLGLDFGNTAYNDHHFHYGYFVYTAAVIGHLDPAWLNEGTNKQWVNTLVRDFANPVTDDSFPFSRAFDWFHGHSWAKGLFESADGKDQESTSEDTFATFAIKMWGRTIGDPNMEARGNLQLAIQARSVNDYFLLKSDNKNQPPLFLFNKVTGILFENKVDHTTYFGNRIEYIQGIHMIPLNPSSAYTRPRDFVTEEWNTYFSEGRVNNIAGGWRGILYANLALIDPRTSYNYFADPNFDYGSLDGGASRTWYLAYAAAMLNIGAAEGEPQQVYVPPPSTPGECVAQPPPVNTPSPPTQPGPGQSYPPPPEQPPYQAPPPPQPQPEAPSYVAPPPPPPPPASYDAAPEPEYPAPPPPAPQSQYNAAPAPRPAPPSRPASPYSNWRNYFDKYRNNALHDDSTDNGARWSQWDSPYWRGVGGERATAGKKEVVGAEGGVPEEVQVPEQVQGEKMVEAQVDGGEEEGEWEDVLECDD